MKENQSESFGPATTAIDEFTDQCVPSKLIKGKRILDNSAPNKLKLKGWSENATSCIADLKIQETKNFGQNLSNRRQVKSKIKTSYLVYLEGLLGLTDKESTCDTQKKVVFFLEEPHSPTPHPLKQNDTLVTDTKQKLPYTVPNANLSLRPKHLSP